MDLDVGKRLIELRGQVISNFDAGNWEEVGLLTGFSSVIDNHPRLLRSLHWSDEDYAGNALVVLSTIAKHNLSAIKIIEDYVQERFPSESVYISAKPSERKITYAPSVFSIPDSNVEPNLVTLMMPFAAELSEIGVREQFLIATNQLRVLSALRSTGIS